MTDNERLRNKIAKLAGETSAPGPEGRRIAGDGDDLIAAILAEIDETILGRSLRFKNTAGAVVTVEAAGRRLLRVTEAPDAAPPLTDPIGEEAEAQIAALTACLKTFAEGGAPLHVRSFPLDRRPDPANVGRSAEALAALFETTLPEPPPPQAATDEAPAPESPTPDLSETPPADALPTGFETLLEGTQWAKFDGEGSITAQSQDAPRADLTGEEVRTALVSELGEGSTHRALAVTAANGAAIFLGLHRGGGIAVAAPRAALPALFSTWNGSG